MKGKWHELQTYPVRAEGIQPIASGSRALDPVHPIRQTQYAYGRPFDFLRFNGYFGYV
jgi:hypothetical protein